MKTNNTDLSHNRDYCKPAKQDLQNSIVQSSPSFEDGQFSKEQKKEIWEICEQSILKSLQEYRIS